MTDSLRALLARVSSPFTPSRLVPNRVVWVGLIELFRGARTRRPAGFGAGLALVFFGFLRSRRPEGGELIFTKRVKEGQGLTIRVVRGDDVVGTVDV